MKFLTNVWPNYSTIGFTFFSEYLNFLKNKKIKYIQIYLESVKLSLNDT